MRVEWGSSCNVSRGEAATMWVEGGSRKPLLVIPSTQWQKGWVEGQLWTVNHSKLCLNINAWRNTETRCVAYCSRNVFFAISLGILYLSLLFCVFCRGKPPKSSLFKPNIKKTFWIHFQLNHFLQGGVCWCVCLCVCLNVGSILIFFLLLQIKDFN